MDTITVDNADDLDNAFRAKQRAKRLNKPTTDAEVSTAPLLKAPTTKKTAAKKTTKKSSAAPPVPAPPPSYFEQAEDAFADHMPDMGWGSMGGDAAGPDVDDAEYKEYERTMQELASKANKINMYYQLFPETRPHAVNRKTGKMAEMEKTWTGEDEPNSIMMEYDRVKLVVNSRNAPQSALNLIIGMGAGIEWCTMVKGWNPMDMRLDGLGSAVKKAATEPDMKGDIDQLSIEYNDYLATRPELRLLQKIAQICITVHVANTGAPIPAAVLHPKRNL